MSTDEDFGSAPDPAALRKLAQKALSSAEYRRKFWRLDYYEPYPAQRRFHELGATAKERCLMASNRSGKTYSGAHEVAFHLSGLYPPDWKGKRFRKPVKGWAIGETSLVTRDIMQAQLCGEPGNAELFGTGAIPLECFVGKPTLARSVADAYDTITVRHVSGGTSTLRFKSYEQGRAKFQGEALHFAWGDEEPPADVYSEVMTRLAPTTDNPDGGIMLLTFTPLKGPQGVVLKYLQEPSADRVTVGMTLEDAQHISPAERERLIESWPEHEREARSTGKPMLGSGAVFQVLERDIVEARLDWVPGHWAKLWGIDFGIDHPNASVLIFWDRDADVIHVDFAQKARNEMIGQHARRIKDVAVNVPVAWPHDGTQRDKTSGEPLSRLYKSQGLRMLETHATWPTGGYSFEAGIAEMQERFKTGRLKIARECVELLEEIRWYHRKDGIIVKINDDLLSALRVAIMMKRRALPVPMLTADEMASSGAHAGWDGKRRKGPQMASGIDFDLFDQ